MFNPEADGEGAASFKATPRLEDDNRTPVEADVQGMLDRVEAADSTLELNLVKAEIADAVSEGSLSRADALQITEAIAAKRPDVHLMQHKNELAQMQGAVTIAALRYAKLNIDRFKNRDDTDEQIAEINEAFDSRLADLMKENVDRLVAQFEENSPDYAISIYIDALRMHDAGDISDEGLQRCQELRDQKLIELKEYTAQKHIGAIQNTNNISTLKVFQQQITNDAASGHISKANESHCNEALAHRLLQLQGEQYDILRQQIESTENPDDLYAVYEAIRTIHCPDGQRFANLNEPGARDLIRLIREIQSVPVSA